MSEMADRMPRPPMFLPAGGNNGPLIDYLMRLCDAMDRTIRELEQEIKRLQEGKKNE